VRDLRRRRMTQHQPPAATRQFASARVEHGNFETFYLEAGSGQPVLLIHGSGPGVSGRANWQALLASPLATHFRFIAPDVAGFGATRCAEGTELTHDTRVEQLLGFLHALQLQSVDVIGHSMGGGLALALAHAWPGRVRRMVLMGSMGISFPISEGLEQVWGYTPSIA